jgi:hypothetical protein
MAEPKSFASGTLGGLFSNALYDGLKALCGGTVVAFLTVAWQYIRHRPIDWWGMVALGALVCGVLGSLLRLQRCPMQKDATSSLSPNKITPEPSVPLPWEGYSSEEACKSATAEQNRLVKLGQSVDGLLTPLQTEIINLRADLVAFLDEYGSFPEPPNRPPLPFDVGTFTPGQKEWIQSVIAWTHQYYEWARKLKYGYREKFAPRVLNLMNKLSSTGMTVAGFEMYATDLYPRDHYSGLINILEQTIWWLGHIPSTPVQAKILKMVSDMSADEFLAACGDEQFKELLDDFPAKD